MEDKNTYYQDKTRNPEKFAARVAEASKEYEQLFNFAQHNDLNVEELLKKPGRILLPAAGNGPTTVAFIEVLKKHRIDNKTIVAIDPDPVSIKNTNELKLPIQTFTGTLENYLNEQSSEPILAIFGLRVPAEGVVVATGKAIKAHAFAPDAFALFSTEQTFPNYDPAAVDDRKIFDTWMENQPKEQLPRICKSWTADENTFGFTTFYALAR